METIVGRWRWRGLEKDMYGRFCATSILDGDGEEIILGGEAQWSGQLILRSKEHGDVILAAPDLLAACRAALDEYPTDDGPNGIGTAGIIWAAINKAGG